MLTSHTVWLGWKRREGLQEEERGERRGELRDRLLLFQEGDDLISEVLSSAPAHNKMQDQLSVLAECHTKSTANSELDCRQVDVVHAKQVVVNHELEGERNVRLMRLEDLVHHCSRQQQISQPKDAQRR